jgi:hypothetical protein
MSRVNDNFEEPLISMLHDYIPGQLGVQRLNEAR